MSFSGEWTHTGPCWMEHSIQYFDMELGVEFWDVYLCLALL